MIGVALLWFFVGLGVGIWGAVKLVVYYIQHGPVETVRRSLWQLSELFVLRPERPAERQFQCTNEKCSCYGMEQCPICGSHFDLDEDDDETDEEAPAPDRSREVERS